MGKNKIEGSSYYRGVEVEHVVKEIINDWKVEEEVYEGLFERKGIELFSPAYIEVNGEQDINEEFEKIKRFLALYMDVSEEALMIEFINYGSTELVFVVTYLDGRRVTLLVKQPAVSYGKVKEEADNLTELNKRDKNVIAPIEYFANSGQELYATPYIMQARCVASFNGAWGMYVPEPYYRFEPFTSEQASVVNRCMIAKLVSLYDQDKEEGIACCKLGGGDFMLPRGWESKPATIEETLEQIYLIAAREKIKCTFEEYLQIIRDEFSRATIDEDQSNLIMNLRARAPIDISDIEAGIELGKSIGESDPVKNLHHKC